MAGCLPVGKHAVTFFSVSERRTGGKTLFFSTPAKDLQAHHVPRGTVLPDWLHVGMVVQIEVAPVNGYVIVHRRGLFHAIQANGRGATDEVLHAPTRDLGALLQALDEAGHREAVPSVISIVSGTQFWNPPMEIFR
jgi:hypothetical protein